MFMEYAEALCQGHCVASTTLMQLLMWEYMSHWPFLLHVAMVMHCNGLSIAGCVQYNTITSTDAGVHASSTVQEARAHSSDKDADIQPQTTTTGIYIFVIL